MKRGTRNTLVTLTLLMMWGQALASPFLACRHLHASQIESEQQHVEHAQLPMEPTPNAVHAGHHMHMQSAVIAEHAATVAEHHPAGAVASHPHSTADCDQSCQFCRSLNTPDLGDAFNPEHPAHMPWNGLTFEFSIALPPLIDHFRPPTVA